MNKNNQEINEKDDLESFLSEYTEESNEDFSATDDVLQMSANDKDNANTPKNEKKHNDVKKVIIKKKQMFEIITPNYDEVDLLLFQKVRKKTNLTVQSFAEVLGVTESTVEKWESGECRPHNATLRFYYLLNKKPSLFRFLFDIEMSKLDEESD